MKLANVIYQCKDKMTIIWHQTQKKHEQPVQVQAQKIRENGNGTYNNERRLYCQNEDEKLEQKSLNSLQKLNPCYIQLSDIYSSLQFSRAF